MADSNSTVSYQPPAKDPSTTAHPGPNAPDPTLTTDKTTGQATDTFTTAASQEEEDASRGQSTSTTARPAQLTDLRLTLRSALRQFPDFPQPGILFEDILPIFANPTLHANLIDALELHITETYGSSQKPDVIVGLEARGFLFGPSLALRLGAGFVPVRKEGKLPGECVTVGYEKEYGSDNFQMQADGIKKGARVLIVDDIIATGEFLIVTFYGDDVALFVAFDLERLATSSLFPNGPLTNSLTTGGTAAAAGSLVKQLGGQLMGYLFILELDFLKGRDKLDAPVFTLLASQEEKK